MNNGMIEFSDDACLNTLATFTIPALNFAQSSRFQGIHHAMNRGKLIERPVLLNQGQLTERPDLIGHIEGH